MLFKPEFLDLATTDILGRTVFLRGRPDIIGCLVTFPLPQNANSNPAASCDNQKYLQIFPNVPREAKSPPAEN